MVVPEIYTNGQTDTDAEMESQRSDVWCQIDVRVELLHD